MGKITTLSIAGIPTLSSHQRAFNTRIKEYLERITGFPIKDKNIFKLELEHNGNIKVPRMSVQIGMKSDQDELIVAIFETADWYLICTKSRGALVDSPMYLDAGDVVAVVEYKYAFA